MRGINVKEKLCFVVYICDNWYIFKILDCIIVIKNVYLFCKLHLHKWFPLVSSSGEQFHLSLFLKFMCVC